MFPRLISRLRALRRRRAFEEGLSDELRFHLDAYADDLVRSGVSPGEAARRARLEFGSVDNVRADCREARGVLAIDALQSYGHDALRRLRAAPARTITMVATLATCLGANVAVFGLVDAVLLRPLPMADDDRLVSIHNTYPRAGVPDDGSTLTNYYERRGRLAALPSLAVYRGGAANVGEPGSTEREFLTRVSPDFFRTIGVVPALGRAFTEAETAFENDKVAIVTHGYWKEKLGADARVIGRSMRIDGARVRIVGVWPEGFSFLSSKVRIYLPLSSPPDERVAERRHSGSSTHMIGRLAPGATVAAAQAQVDAHNAAMEAGNPRAAFIADAGFRSLVVPLRASHVASVRPTLLLVGAAVASLLLIGVVNVLTLLLISYADRLHELAIRQAMGATWRHVVGEVAAETILISVIGGLLGLGVGAAGLRLLAQLGATRLPLGAHVQFDVRVAVAGLVGIVLIGAVIALPLAWYRVRAFVPDAVLHARGATAGPVARRMRHGFVVAQIALAVMLLATAGLLAVSLRQVEAVPTGFRPERVLSAQVSLPWRVYGDSASRYRFVDHVMDEMHAHPGVLAVGVATNVPLSGNTNKSSATVKELRTTLGEAPHGIYAYAVAGDYFTAMGLSLREGRFLTRDDVRLAPRVCVVDEDFARRYWPGGGAVGQRLFQGSEAGSDAEAYTIVGVVGRVAQAGLAANEAPGAVYYPYSDRFDSALYVVARTAQQPESLAPLLQRAVRTFDPELPVNNVRTMDTRVADSLVTRRSPALLAGMFAGVALLLIGIGIYGVLSYAVSQRRREIGVRMALGARPAQVRRQFTTMAARLLAAGLLIGLPGAWMAGRAMQAILFNVPALHPLTFAATACIVSIVSMAACIVPAYRAARTSPAEVLAEV
jgi:predicted permease